MNPQTYRLILTAFAMSLYDADRDDAIAWAHQIAARGVELSFAEVWASAAQRFVAADPDGYDPLARAGTSTWR